MNECLTSPCNCYQEEKCIANCTDSVGSFKCSCNQGFKLYTDQKTCIDVNECSLFNSNDCQQKCFNTIGSFLCRCDKGYRLSQDLKTCIGRKKNYFSDFVQIETIRAQLTEILKTEISILPDSLC